jgi:hypothetical protein
MKQWFADLFSESSDVSMTRFLSFVCVITSTLIALYAVGTRSDLTATAGLCSVFLGAGLGAKVWQRSIESKELPDEKV